LDIFEKFFGSTNPYTDHFVKGNEVCEKKENPNAPASIEHVLNCSIFEFYNGSLKTFTFHRDCLMADGKGIDNREETMTVEVKPGFDIDTVLDYPSKGNQKFAEY